MSCRMFSSTPGPRSTPLPPTPPSNGDNKTMSPDIARCLPGGQNCPHPPILRTTGLVNGKKESVLYGIKSIRGNIDHSS